MSRDVALLEKAGEREIEETPDTGIPELAEPEPDKELEEEVKKELAEEKLDETLAEVPAAYHVSFKAINEKYPNFFKEFRDFREIVGRHSEFTKIFPTVSDAADAFERAEEFDQINEDILQGNVQNLLESIKEGNPGKYEEILLKLLPYVGEKDPRGLYVKMTAPVIDNFIKSLYNAGLASRNEDIQNSALQAAHWAFGNEEYATGKLAVQPFGVAKPTEEQVRFEEEKRQYLARKYNDIQLSVSAFVEKKVKANIEEGLKSIPNGFTRRMIVDDVWSQIQDNLEANSQHMRNMNTMWKKAARTSFDEEWRKRIITALVQRAYPMIPGLRNKVVTEALGNTPQKPEGIKIKGDDPNLGKASGHVTQIKGIDPKKIDRSRTSDYDMIAARGGDPDAKVFLKGK